MELSDMGPGCDQPRSRRRGLAGLLDRSGVGEIWGALPPRQRLAVALVALLLVPNPVLALRDILPVPAQPDFAGYFLAARALNAGLSPYDADVASRLAQDGGGLWYFSYLYPPGFAALLRPLAVLPFHVAKVFWFAANLSCCVWGALLAAQIAGLDRARRWLVVAALPFLPPIHYTLELGQVNGVLLVLVALAVTTPRLGPRPRRHGLRGFALGVAAGIKVFPALLVVPWLIRREWRQVGGAALGIMGLGAVGILLGGGFASLGQWFGDVLPAAAAGRAFPSNQSIWAVADRLFSSQSFDAVRLDLGARAVDVPPLMQMRPLGSVVAGALAAVLVVSTVLATLRHTRSAGTGQAVPSSLLALTCALLITPIVWDHYYLLLLLPICYLAVATHGRAAARWLLLVGCGLLAAHRYWRVLLLLQSPVLLGLGASGMLALWLAQVRLLWGGRIAPGDKAPA